MGCAKTTSTKRSASSPSLFRRLSFRSPRAFLSRRSSRRSVASEGDDDGGPVFLPLMRVVSPFTLPVISEQLLAPPLAPHQQPQRGRPSSHRKSTSWSDFFAAFARRGVFDDAHSDDGEKRKPKFTLESPSDLDLPHMPSHPSSTFAANTLMSPLPRPHLVRRHARDNPTRRYTFAMAMTDEQITDEVLVEELEKMRAVRAWTGRTCSDLEDFWDLGGSPTHFSDEPLNDSPEADDELDYMGIVMATRAPPASPSGPSFNFGSTTSSPTPLLAGSDASWHTARRALLTCRESVRTERHYLNGMRALLSQATDTPPPPLMLKHAEHLVETSEALLARMEENPNVWGVTTAFLEAEAPLEEGLVGWCGAVGEWFEGNMADGEKHEHKDWGKWMENLLSHPPSSVKPKTGDESPRTTLKRTMSGWRRSSLLVESLPSPSSSSSSSSASSGAPSTSTSTASSPNSSIPSSASRSKASTPPAPATNSAPDQKRERERDRGWLKMTPPALDLTSPTLTEQQNLGSTKSSYSAVPGICGPSSDNTALRTARKPAVRELAILPTQRVMRYVLLFRDLLAHVPATSPSRTLVERAVDAAVRIASKCDRAQDHSAFVRLQSKVNNHESGGPPIGAWSRRLSLNKPRERETFAHGKAVSEDGHLSNSPDAIAAMSLSPPPSRPASTCSQTHGRKVLIKPRRSSSTSAVVDAGAAIANTGKTVGHSGDCSNRLTKSKGRTQSGAPPPSSFALMGRREFIPSLS